VPLKICEDGHSGFEGFGINFLGIELYSSTIGFASDNVLSLGNLTIRYGYFGKS
jgi:hypothetical protein